MPLTNRRRPAVAALATLCIGIGALAAGPVSAADSAVEELGDFARWDDGRIAESSGLAWWREHLVTTNDSGDEAVLYVADREGQETGRIRYARTEPTDVEALALGPGNTIWVGDIGDNALARDGIAVYELDAPGLAGEIEVTGRRYDLAYPDGPHNAETLLVHPVTGDLYVVTKALIGAVYRAPAPLRTGEVNTLERVAAAPTILTDGTFAPDGKVAYLRGYAGLSVHALPGFERVASLSTPVQKQGEGLANGPDNTLLASTEGAGSAVQQWRIPADVVAAATGTNTATTTPTPTPTASATATTGAATPAATSPSSSAATPASRSDASSSTWRRLLPIALLGLIVALAVLARRGRGAGHRD